MRGAVSARSWPHTAFAAATGLVCVVLAVSGVVGCTLRFGDPAEIIMYENRRDEPVRISYRYDNQADYWEGVTLTPRSRVTEPVMIQSTGVQIRAVGASGTVLLDRHYVWKEVPPGARISIVIDQQVTPE